MNQKGNLIQTEEANCSEIRNSYKYDVIKTDKKSRGDFKGLEDEIETCYITSEMTDKEIIQRVEDFED